VRWALLPVLLPALLVAQQAQNPSPMVEHTRAHRRLKEESPPGRREKLDLGTLFVPAGLKARAGVPVLFFFHGGTWLPELAGARNRVAVVSIQAGAGSGSYARLFEDSKRFLALLEDTESRSGIRFGRIMLGGWSA
jgi:acetyl esterase/lipase